MIVLTDPPDPDALHLVAAAAGRNGFSVLSAWCEDPADEKPKGHRRFVFEPLFATCERCLAARTEASQAVKP